VISGTVISGGKLVITVTNQGLGPLTSATVAVSVFDLAGTGLLGSGSAGPLTLTPGASIDVKTNYAIPAGPVQLLVIVDPQGTIPETDDTNNRLSVAIGGGGAQPTKTPTQQPTQHPTPTP
jgi:subtilase family serine protease